MGWWQRRFGGLPRAFWGLMSGVGLARLGFFAVPFLTFWLVADRHFTAAQAAVVMTAFGLGWTLSMPLGGWLADRLGRRLVIVSSAFGAAAAYVAIGGAQGLLWTAGLAFATGLTFDLYRPAVQAFLTDVVPGDHRKRALGLLYLVMNVSRMVACVLGGLLASRAFFVLFLVNAAVNVLFGLLALRLPASSSTSARNVGFGAALRDPALIGFTAITAVFYSVHMQSMVSLPIVFSSVGATPLDYGLLLALDPLVVVVVQLLFQQWLLRTPALVVCALGAGMVGIGLALTGLSGSLGEAALTIPLWVAGEVAFLTAAPGVVAMIAPEHLRGVYFGVWGGTQGLAAVAAPLVASLLAGSLLIWLGGAVFGVIAGVACLGLRGWLLRRRTDLAAVPVRAAIRS
ncbi:MFS family permease [Hamadaea flava]|uniref:MFS transporter n=1 Tax=Hamadaea flava TaxID=1742688 RepID=A0ABV8LYL3_9ACTN|nr:MFS transporter [Hamadaea flava]MCP2324662.1 MFS family permease [Hamadaea flava]